MGFSREQREVGLGSWTVGCSGALGLFSPVPVKPEKSPMAKGTCRMLSPPNFCKQGALG